MATFLFDKIIFGPVKSRRFGMSLGINLLPTDSKLCNYNCVYCECGWSGNKKNVLLPPASTVKSALLSYFKNAEYGNIVPDVITFAGNGEPTLHPEFETIINDTIEIRNNFFPQIKIVVLTNATRLHKKSVVDALKKIDLPVLKIDTMIQQDYEIVNGPNTLTIIEEIAKQIKKSFNEPIIQTMFFRYKNHNTDFDNTTNESLSKYLKMLKEIRASLVMIYSVSRDTPTIGIEKCELSKLNEIASQIESLGIKTLVTP